MKITVKIPSRLREWIKEESTQLRLNEASLIRLLILDAIQNEGRDEVIARGQRYPSDYDFSFFATQEFVDLVGGRNGFCALLRGACLIAQEKSLKKQMTIRIAYVEAAA